MEYKRNQIEEAISCVFEPGSAKPSSEVRTRLKRLLETDRGLGRKKRSADPERANFAFYSMDAPGRGVEIWFSQYEAFALLTGLRLMQHGWPQGFAVAVLRRVRPELEKQHARILRQDPATLLDQQLIVQRAKPGDLFVGNTDPVFLTITPAERKDPSGPISCTICRGQAELMRRTVRDSVAGQSWTIFELANLVHALSSELSKTRPRQRGRGSE
jgi:hypothetical protein